MPTFDTNAFHAALNSASLGAAIIAQASTGSTNDDARAAASEGMPHGAVFVADEQTNGRGRRGNAWSAPRGACILASLLLRPDTAAEIWPRYTHVAGLAIAQALDACGLDAQLKWPNDVYLNGKKVAGILVETAWQGTQGFVVLGFGINALGSSEHFPPELRESLTTVEAEALTASVSREWLLAQVLNRLEILLPQAETNFQSMLDEAWRRSWLRGHAITLQADGMTRSGVAVGLSPIGGLLIRAANGEVHEYWSADIVRRA
jgi:BirA family transcriptional regulator, biotin operon repressor / biotin---[acetyl-CoA-carboxylase] ligase